MEARGIELITRLTKLQDLLDDCEGVDNIFRYRLTFYTKEESERMIPLIKREIESTMYDLMKFNQLCTICNINVKIPLDPSSAMA